MGPKANAKKTTRPKKRAAPRARLASLRVSGGFREFVLDQLAGVRDFRAQAMFGGVGLYSGDVFFGILAADVLYFKAGDSNRAEYEQAGSKPFKPYADRAMKMPYYNVPTAILEDAAALAVWAERAIAVAKATHARRR
jgi:DNA transformation protein